MKIVGLNRKFKLKLLGIGLIFMMAAPSMLPSLLSSINLSIINQKTNGFSNLVIFSNYISLIYSKQNSQLSAYKLSSANIQHEPEIVK